MFMLWLGSRVTSTTITIEPNYAITLTTVRAIIAHRLKALADRVRNDVDRLTTDHYRNYLAMSLHDERAP
jgi:cyclopropane fatty-acyl-phospholipid synthase-like methyltransferase